MERPGADSVEKREPVSDIDTATVASLKALDPNRPIREATNQGTSRDVRNVPGTDSCAARNKDKAPFRLRAGLM